MSPVTAVTRARTMCLSRQTWFLDLLRRLAPEGEGVIPPPVRRVQHGTMTVSTVVAFLVSLCPSCFTLSPYPSSRAKLIFFQCSIALSKTAQRLLMAGPTNWNVCIRFYQCCKTSFPVFSTRTLELFVQFFIFRLTLDIP